MDAEELARSVDTKIVRENHSSNTRLSKTLDDFIRPLLREPCKGLRQGLHLLA